MSYIKDGSVYPYNPNPGQLKRDFPAVSFPRDPSDATLAEYNIYPVAQVAQPPYDPATQNIAEGFPVEGPANVWTQTWVVTAKSQQEQDDYAQSVQRSNNQAAVKSTVTVQDLMNATPDEIDTIMDGVNNIPEIRDVLRQAVKALSVQVQQSGVLDP